jgi:hypothetical protein
MEIAVPMDYRDHFPGTFENYLGLLEETIHRQKVWAAECEHLYIGIAVNFLFQEEKAGPFPKAKLRNTLDRIESAGAEGVVMFCAGQLDGYEMWDVVKQKFVG